MTGGLSAVSRQLAVPDLRSPPPLLPGLSWRRAGDLLARRAHRTTVSQGVPGPGTCGPVPARRPAATRCRVRFGMRKPPGTGHRGLSRGLRCRLANQHSRVYRKPGPVPGFYSAYPRYVESARPDPGSNPGRPWLRAFEGEAPPLPPPKSWHTAVPGYGPAVECSAGETRAHQRQGVAPVEG